MHCCARAHARCDCPILLSPLFCPAKRSDLFFPFFLRVSPHAPHSTRVVFPAARSIAQNSARPHFAQNQPAQSFALHPDSRRQKQSTLGAQKKWLFMGAAIATCEAAGDRQECHPRHPQLLSSGLRSGLRSGSRILQGPRLLGQGLGCLVRPCSRPLRFAVALSS